MNKENEFFIASHPGGSFTHASFTYQSIYGLVFSSWKKTEAEYHYEIVVPSNCTAIICLPNQDKKIVHASRYTFDEMI